MQILVQDMADQISKKQANLNLTEVLYICISLLESEWHAEHLHLKKEYLDTHLNYKNLYLP